MGEPSAEKAAWIRESDPALMGKLDALANVFRAQSAETDPVASSNRFAGGISSVLGEEGFMSVSLRGAEPGYFRVMRMLHQPGVDQAGITDTLFAGTDAPYVTGGIISEIVKADGPLMLRELDVRDDPVLGNQIAAYRVLISVPVFNDGDALNFVVFMNTDPDAYDQYACQVHLLVANLIGNVTNSKRMIAELQQAQTWIQQEIDEIATLQRSLVPWNMPPIPGLRCAGYYDTFDRAGGDYYDLLPLSDWSGRWIMFIADASGHGPSAAVLVAMINALLHNLPAEMESPGEILAHVNDYLCGRSMNHSFMTAFCAVYDPKDRSLVYSSAGHNMPLVRDAAGKVNMFLPTGGVPLGVISDYVFKDATTNLEPGQAVLLYTDGITEAESPKRLQFREARLLDCFAEAKGSAQEQLAHIVKVVRDHEAGQRPADDQSILLICVDPD